MDEESHAPNDREKKVASFELSTIDNVEIWEIWKSEPKDFTPWLAENISLLGDALNLKLESTSTETSVGSFKLDILARDADRDLHVAIENQLGDTDHSHLGQLLTYAAGHDAKVAIWIAGKFREEHREALDMLNRRTHDDSEFYGVVVELWKIDGSRPAPHFRVVSAPNNWGKAQKLAGDIGEREQRYYDFFQGLVDKLGSGPDVPIHYKVAAKSWLDFRSGYSGFHYSANFSSQADDQARVELYIGGGDRETNKERFDSLEDHKNQIESEVGGKFSWQRMDDKKACRIRTFTKGSIRGDEKQLADIQDWMMGKLTKFKRAFDPKLTELIGKSN